MLYKITCQIYTGVGMEAIEGLCFLASLPLAGTGRTEGGEKMQPFNRFHSRLFKFVLLLHSLRFVPSIFLRHQIHAAATQVLFNQICSIATAAALQCSLTRRHFFPSCRRTSTTKTKSPHFTDRAHPHAHFPSILIRIKQAARVEPLAPSLSRSVPPSQLCRPI